jgi:hypothetical protein
MAIEKGMILSTKIERVIIVGLPKTSLDIKVIGIYTIDVTTLYTSYHHGRNLY